MPKSLYILLVILFLGIGGNTLAAPNVNRQVRCLAENIYYESRGEPFVGQVSVAMVTINRVKSGIFSDNICQVVRERDGRKCQFSWFCEKDKHKPPRNTSKTFEGCLFLAKFIYHNHEHIKDPTNGALYFHAKKVEVKVRGKKVRAVIGNHIFYNIAQNHKSIARIALNEKTK